MVATACSFDAGKLRAPKDPARDAASYRPDTFDVGAGVGLDPDADGRADGQRAVGDLAIRVDGPILGDGSPVDWTGGQEVSVGLDGADDAPGPDPGAIDGGSMASGGAGGSADGSATGGVGGMAGEVGGGGGTDVDGGLVGAGGEATGGSGGVGGTGGGGTGAVATGGTGGGGTGGVYLDAAAPDASDSGADGAPTIDPDLVLWYRFDETSGTTAYDSAAFGGVARNATLATAGMGAGATFSTVKQVGTRALAFSSYTYYAGSGSYVVIPTLHTLAPDAVTIAVWVRLDVATANQNWERIFDYGDSSTGPNWFNLTARSSSSPYGPIFAMSNTGHATTDQQRLISSTAITANVWHHVAIVLGAGAPYTGFMYLDGVVVASNDAMTLHLADIGSTVNNWLGRSEFTSDPYFSGSMDDFRVYKRAFTQEEIAALMTVR